MPRNSRVAFVHAFAAAVLVLAWVVPAWAHDLSVDRLFLRLEGRRLVGELVLDPELSREPSPVTPEQRRERVRKLASDNLKIEIDGQPRAVEFQVMELFVDDGASAGDLVSLLLPLERRPSRLRAHVGAPLRSLVLSVGVSSKSGAALHSVLVEGGTWSPEYRFGTAEASSAWKEGGPEQFDALRPRRAHRAPGASGSADQGSTPPVASAVADVLPEKESGFVGESSGGAFFRYLKLGFEHILPAGLDHVLFVAGLVFGCRRLRPLLLQLSAFTLAHTVTLGLGALGLVHVPSRIVEPLIALSIAFVAFENLSGRGESRYRPAIVFGFGLLHGLGFAGALAETGLPRESLLTSLLAFNVGVELGQLCVVVVLLAALRLVTDEARLKRFVVTPSSLAIAGVAAYWTLTRLFS